MKENFITAYIATFGGTRKNAEDIYKISSTSYIKEIINGFHNDCKKSFYND